LKKRLQEVKNMYNLNSDGCNVAETCNHEPLICST